MITSEREALPGCFSLEAAANPFITPLAVEMTHIMNLRHAFSTAGDGIEIGILPSSTIVRAANR